uniref:Pheromone n=1 Tax=Lentinula edodes TaxID=5353 RepID=A0A2U9Q1E2_LENED|nr:Pheromone [Lentinula edodes]AWT58017.1 Pheromone [Lentinula edodes]AWT58054.1 Pheromone [Lentinula edodes]AWT58060.1 Pheromone [Lentinula edodes]
MDSFTQTSIHAICALDPCDLTEGPINITFSDFASEPSTTSALPVDLERPSNSGAVADFGYCIIA